MSEVEDKPMVESTMEEKPVEPTVTPAVESQDPVAEENKTGDEKQEKPSANGPRKGIVSDASVLPKSTDHTEIVKQVEFYFADANLRFDKFLYSLVTAENKWVDIDMVANFNRMRRFNLEEVYKAMEKSEFMELNEDKTKMRRKSPLAAVKEGNKIVDHSLDRSLYAKGFGIETPSSQFDIEKLFESTGLKVNAVRLRRDNDKVFKGSVFVEFKDVKTLQDFVALESKPKWNDEEMKQIQPSSTEVNQDTQATPDSQKKEELPTVEKATKEAEEGIRFMTKRAFVEMKMDDIKAGRIKPNPSHLQSQKFDAFKDNSSGSHRGGRGGGHRPHRGNSNSARRDRDRDNGDKDWKTRREEDRKSGFRDNRDRRDNNSHRGGRDRRNGDRDSRDNRGHGGSGRRSPGPRDRDGNGIPKIKSSAEPKKDDADKMETTQTNGGVESKGAGVPKREREEDSVPEAKKAKVDG